jgi:hypothetical protein
MCRDVTHGRLAGLLADSNLRAPVAVLSAGHLTSFGNRFRRHDGRHNLPLKR